MSLAIFISLLRQGKLHIYWPLEGNFLFYVADVSDLVGKKCEIYFWIAYLFLKTCTKLQV